MSLIRLRNLSWELSQISIYEKLNVKELRPQIIRELQQKIGNEIQFLERAEKSTS
jgi:hypothetical protein